MKGTASLELELPAPAGEAWAIYGSLQLGRLATELIPGFIQKVELVEGDGGAGTVLRVTSPPSGGSSEPLVFKEKFIRVDDEKLVKVTEMVEGGFLDLGFRTYRVTLEIIEASSADSSVIRSTIDYDVEEGSEANAGLVNTDALAALAEAIRNYLSQKKLHSDRLSPDVRQSVLSSFPHYGHSGIVESARELFMQLDGQPCNKEEFPSENTGFLFSLLGPGCECQGYKIRIVGHSLGGAVGAVLGLRLSGRYPDLHVYSYGTPPCVDKVIAEACSDFVTSIVYNDEFSSRLSVNSIIRLRAAAMTALSDNSSSDSAMIYKLARRILHINKPEEIRENDNIPALSCQSADVVVENGNQRCRRKHVKYTVKGGVFLCSHAFSCMLNMPSHYPCKTLKDDAPELSSGIRVDSNGIYDKRGSGLTAGSGGHEGFPYREVTSLIDGNCAEVSEDDVINFNNGDVSKQADATNTNDMVCFDGSDDLISFEDHSSLDTTTSSIQVSIVETPEMFLPGLIIYVVPERKSTLPLWNSWRIQDGKHGYRAFLANRESFKDIVITPYMFLDHLPWRCHYAMQRVLETRRAEGRLNADCLNAEHII